jgi:hypothetical protein
MTIDYENKLNNAIKKTKELIDLWMQSDYLYPSNSSHTMLATLGRAICSCGIDPEPFAMELYWALEDRINTLQKELDAI